MQLVVAACVLKWVAANGVRWVAEDPVEVALVMTGKCARWWRWLLPGGTNYWMNGLTPAWSHLCGGEVHHGEHRPVVVGWPKSGGRHNCCILVHHAHVVIALVCRVEACSKGRPTGHFVDGCVRMLLVRMPHVVAPVEIG